VTGQPVGAPGGSLPGGPGAGERIHVVQPGDWLSKISITYYGDMSKVDLIHQRNLAVIGPNKDLIKPGQRLVIP
jgi:nucleoid-associated protein YgaU